MKLLSALFAAALLATAVSPVSARHHRSQPSSSSEVERVESRLESLVHKIESLEQRFEQRREEAEQVEEDEDESSFEDEEEDEEEPEAESDDASFAEVADPTLSTWSHFSHTWTDPFKKSEVDGFFTVPHLNTTSLDASGWVHDASKPCESGSAIGHRYKKTPTDANGNALWMLYGANGELAGLQSVVYVNPGEKNLSPSGPYVRDIGVHGEEVYTISAYFRNPKDGSICNAATPKTGRVGDGLWLAYNGEASQAEAIPLSVNPKQPTIPVNSPGQRPYTQGHCMSTMGVHWWRSRWNDKCDGKNALDPYFLLYHPKTNQLLGFGLIQLLGVATEYQQGNYWEHVPVVAAPLFQKPSQLSLDLIKGAIDGRGFVLQSQHYYFINNPRKEINCFPFFPSPVPPANAGEVVKQAEAYAASQQHPRALPRSTGRKAAGKIAAKKNAAHKKH